MLASGDSSKSVICGSYTGGHPMLSGDVKQGLMEEVHRGCGAR